jgi:hypothetical protein
MLSPGLGAINRPSWLLAVHLFIASLGIQVKNKYNPPSFNIGCYFSKVEKEEMQVESINLSLREA